MIMFFSRNGKLLMNLDLYSSFGYFDGYKDLRSYLSYGIQRSEPTRYHQQQTYMFDKIDINYICIHLLFLISFKFCTLLIKCHMPMFHFMHTSRSNFEIILCTSGRIILLVKIMGFRFITYPFYLWHFIQFDQYILKDE